ncbi:MAG TPA: hypothetical protein VHK65_15120 [Candidatus Dormibacteraeota bacterium]|nr:hypothetical protein [Candidatus Dormibacteraeota bacterium]
MAEIVSDDLVIRAYWPLPQWAGQRTSYGVPLVGAAGVAVVVVVARWLSIGMPVTKPEWTLLLLTVMAMAGAVHMAFRYDGTEIFVNRERLILKKWFRQPTKVSVSDLSRIALCTVQFPGRYSTIDRQVIFFFTRDGHCVISLYWRFRDEDLTQLCATVGIKPEGSWLDSVPQAKLAERFPGAFDQRAA